nr:ribonuclease H-like domain-containing protein [Tanacetum cinerariifolium]
NLERNLKKAKKERNDLKLTLEKFQTSSKNLSKLLESQVGDKTGLGFDCQVFNCQVSACEELYSHESDNRVPKNLENDRYKTCEGYHVVHPLYNGTFMPPKPNLVFTDDPTASELVANVFNFESSIHKPSNDMSNTYRPDAPIVEDWISDSEDETKIESVPKQKEPTFVKSTKHVKTSRESVKKLEHNKQAKNLRTNNQKSRVKHVVNQAHSPVKRPIHQRTTTKNSNFNKMVTTIKVNKVNVVQGTKGNAENTSAYWVWKPKYKVLDHVSRLTSASMTLKKFDYTNALGRSKNISFLLDFEEIDRGYVAFGGNPKGGKIFRKCKIKTGKLDFDDVYFVKKLKFNLFSVLQMCEKKNNVLFTDTECVVLSSDYKLPDENHVLLRVPRENNIYIVDLKNVFPSGGLTCLFAKATLDESNLWHRRLGHINFKTMNKLVNATKDETSAILKTSITGIENQINHKVKIIRCDNGTEFKNNDLNQFCGMKGIKREFSVARTPQQNKVTERKNRTLIEATRTTLADSLLPIPFWAKAINTACYVQNKVLVTKPHNKTPYELLLSRSPSIGFMRPFGCPVTILNTLDPLRRFDGKAAEGFLVGYSVNCKAFRVFNSRTRIVQETLHIYFLENKPNVAGIRPKWLFNIDTLTMSMNYQLVVAGSQPNDNAGIKENLDAGKAGKETVSAQQYVLLPLWSTGLQDPHNTNNDAADAAFDVKENKNDVHVFANGSDKTANQKHDENAKRDDKGKSHVYLLTRVRNLRAEFEEFNFNSSNRVNTVSAPINAAGPNPINNTNSFNTASPSINVVSPNFRISGKSSFMDPFKYPDDPDMPELEDIIYSDDEEDVEEGIDYDEVFALVARIEAIRLFLAYASFMGFMVYVDDIIFGSTNKELCKAFEKLMKDKFQMSSIRELTFFLGLQVKQKDDGIFISHDKYVAEILRKFGFTDVKSASTPIETEKPLLKDSNGEDVDVHIYRSMIGSLMYLTSSRLDIMFAVCACARFQVTPKVSHLHAVKRIFSAYARASLNRKSITGGCQFLGCRLISWQCKKQTIVATSSTEAEYVAIVLKFYGFKISCWTMVNVARHSITAVSYELMLFGLLKVTAVNLMLLGTVKKVNDDVQLHTLIDGKKVDVSEAIIRRDLHLDDADGCLSAKRTAWNEFSYSMASAVICLATGRKFNFSKYIFDNMVRNVDNSNQPTTPHESSMPLLATLMETCATLPQKVAELEKDKHPQALEILQLKKRVKKIERKKKSKSSGLKRLRRLERLNQEDVSAAEPTIFNDEDVTMTMAQILIKLKTEKAKILEQIAQKLHDEEVQKAASRDNQERADMKRALELQDSMMTRKRILIGVLLLNKVHHVSSTRGHDIFMLTKKDYPLSNAVMILILGGKLQVEEDNEMARDLVMKIFMEANKPRSRTKDNAVQRLKETAQRNYCCWFNITAAGSTLVLLDKVDAAAEVLKIYSKSLVLLV